MITSMATLGMGVWPAVAATIPFTEEFVQDAANWRDLAGADALVHHAAGGPDGGAYVSTTFNFVNSTPQPLGGPIFFRGHASYDSSGGAFVGDWLAEEGVTELSFFVRHDAAIDDLDVPMTFFTRLATPVNHPAAIAINPIPVPPNVWTQIVIPIPNDDLIGEGPPGTVEAALSDLGNIQVAVFTPETLAGVDHEFTFELDKVTIVPEPAVGVLLAAGAIAGWARRRRKHGGSL